MKKEKFTFLITLFLGRQFGAHRPYAFVQQAGERGRGTLVQEVTLFCSAEIIQSYFYVLGAFKKCNHTFKQADVWNRRGKAFNSGYQLIFQDRLIKQSINYCSGPGSIIWVEQMTVIWFASGFKSAAFGYIALPNYSPPETHCVKLVFALLSVQERMILVLIYFNTVYSSFIYYLFIWLIFFEYCLVLC